MGVLASVRFGGAAPGGSRQRTVLHNLLARKVLDAHAGSREPRPCGTKSRVLGLMGARVPFWRRLRRRCWYGAAIAALMLLRTVPPATGRWFCKGLARLAYRCRGRERALARDNLALVFPDRGRPWRERFLRHSVDALGDNLHTALTLGRQAARGFPDVIEEPGPDGRGLLEVLQALQGRGRGVLLLTAHLGCWELLGAWLAARLENHAVVTATVRNPAVDRLLQDRRRSLGLRPLARRSGARPLLRALDRGAVVGVLADQNTGASSAQLPFLDRPAATPLGIFRLALRRGAPIVPAAMVRRADRWVARHLDPIEPQSATDAHQLAVACNLAVEQLIHGSPEQWIWFHDRWGLRADRRLS